MDRRLSEMLAYFFKNKRMFRRWHKLLVFMSSVVVFVVTYMLILPAITMEKQPVCGMEEHIHTEECYEEITELICGLEEGEEHTHGEDCYMAERVLICGMEEHTHTEECYPREEETEETAPALEETEESTAAETEEAAVEEITSEETTAEDSCAVPDTFAGSSFADEENISSDNEEYLDIEDMEYGADDDETVSGSGITVIADDVASGAALEGVTSEGYSEAFVEKYTETTTQAPIGEVRSVNASGVIKSGTYEGVAWSISSTASGGYRLTLNAAEGGGVVPSDILTYTGSDGNVVLDEYVSKIEEIAIGSDVVGVSQNAFKDVTSLRTVIIEQNGEGKNSLEYIEKGVFSGCKSLTSINLEDCTSLTTLGCVKENDTHVDKVDGTVLDNAVIGYDGQLLDEQGTFYNTGITSITLPSTLTKIGSYAFSHCGSLETANFCENTNNVSFGIRIFSDCTALTSAGLENLLGNNSFNATSGIYTHTDNSGNVKSTDGDERNAMFNNCTSLTSLTLPQVAAGSNLGYLCYGCTSLKSIDVSKATNLTGANNQMYRFVYNCPIDVLDLTALKNMTTIYNNVVCNKVEKVILPSTVTALGDYAFNGGGGSILSEIVFTPKDDGTYALTSVGTSAFNDIDAVELEVNIANGGSMGAWVFCNCYNLEKVTITSSGTLKNIGTTIGTDYGRVFQSCNSLKEIVWNVKDIYNGTSNYAVNPETFINLNQKVRLTLGSNVEYLNGEFISAMQGYIKDYSFAPNMSFSVYNGAKASVSSDFEEPFNEEGDYFTDEYGNLYHSTGTIGTGEDIKYTAELVYADRDNTGELVIPAEITAVNVTGAVNNYIITGIETGAVREASYTSILFEAPENITSIGDNAFTDSSRLDKIGIVTVGENGEKITTPYTVEKDILAAFTNLTSANTGSELFVGTGIKSSPLGSAVESSNSIQNKAAGATFTITKTTQSSIASLQTEGYLATGEAGTVQVEVTGVDGDTDVYRLYIKTYDGCSVYEGAYTVEDVEYKVTPVSCGDGVYYYDIPAPSPGYKYTIDIGVSYPNNSAPNKSVYAWGVDFKDKDILNSDTYKGKIIYPTDTAEGETPDYTVVANSNDNSSYLSYTWKTVADPFKVKKAQNGNVTPSFKNLGGSPAIISVEGVSFTIELVNQSGSETTRNLGSDHVKYVDFVDKMTLPTGLDWRSGLNDKCSSRCDITSGGGSGSLYATINGTEYLVCTITLDNEKLTALSLGFENGAPTICYTVENGNTDTEIQSARAALTFGPEIIIATDVEIGKTYQAIENSVTADVEYCFSSAEPISGSASVTIATAASRLTFNKQALTKASYLGEDIKYRLTVTNDTAFEYNGILKITDALYDGSSSALYIKPENMQAMFDGEGGDKLIITIKDAILYDNPKSASVTAVDGTKTASISAADTSAAVQGEGSSIYYSGRYRADVDVKCSGTITIEKDKSGSITITYPTRETTTETVTVATDSSIEKELRNIGYVVTKYDKYSVEWNYGENAKVANGKVLTYDFTATVKDTFKYLSDKDNKDNAADYNGGGDHFRYYNQPLYDTKINIDNVATLIEGDSESTTSILSGVGEQGLSQVLYDLMITKGAAVNGIPLEAGEELSIDDDDVVVSYTVTADHRGTGNYSLLPVVDHMTGVQAVLAPVDLNKGASWATDTLPIHTEAGVQYYVLNAEGTYNGVQLTNRYADTITVSETDSGLDTIIKWYCIDVNGDVSVPFDYKAIVSQAYAGNKSTQHSYSLYNEAWLNDHPSHRLWDEIGGGGTTVSFDKKILTHKGKDYTYDKFAENKQTSILPNGGKNVVTYRLEFGSAGGNLRTITHEDIYDMLPKTGATSSVFTWDAGNRVKVSYAVSNADKVSIKYNEKDLTEPSNNTNTEYTLPTVCPGSASSENVDYQQYIQWNNGFEINFQDNSDDCKAFIYVTLTFPSDAATWNSYVDQVGAEALHNTLYIYNTPAQVTHYVSDPGRVLLQKGVYETGYYLWNNSEYYKTTAYYRGADRFHYVSTPKDANNNLINTKNVVTYYIILKNDGKTNLLLSPIYDMLPEGFYFGAFNSIAYHTANNVWYPYVGAVRPLFYSGSGYTTSCQLYDYSDTDNPIAKTAAYKHPVARTSRVKLEGTEMVNGKTRLKFVLTDSKGNALEYLEPGQEIQFGYTCFTGSDKPNEAVNICAMEYIDGGGTGVDVVTKDEEEVIVSSYNNLSPNDGDRSVVKNADAAALGFTETNSANTLVADSDRQWLTSTVSVYSGDIDPSVSKSVEEEVYKFDQSPTWTIKSSNGGTDIITDYTITDTLDAPYKFQGKFTYKIFSNKKAVDRLDDEIFTDESQTQVAKSGSNEYLFEIETRTANDKSVVVKANNGNRTTLEINGAKAELKATLTNADGGTVTVPLKLSISQAADGKETLSINFTDASWCIPANGYSLLTYSSPQVEQVKKAEIYENNVTLTAGSETKNANAQISVYTDYKTTSAKTVTELVEDENGALVENTANTAKSSGKGSIVLAGRESKFRYCLSLNSDESAGMDKLVIVDNLPFEGDAATLRDGSKRGSEYSVSFADSPNVVVKVGGTELASDKYTVSYSSKQSAFTQDDLQGKSYWLASAADARSIRIVLDNVAANSAVEVSFDAKLTSPNDVKPGEIAWNSFGYQYGVNLYNEDGTASENGVWMQAAPAKVGVQIPGAPSIVKSLINTDNSLVKAEKDYTFSFIIYKGEKITFSGYTAADISSKLTGREYTMVTASVAKDSLQSDPVVIDTLGDEHFKYQYENGAFTATTDKFAFENGVVYNIVEIEPEPSEKGVYSFSYINNPLNTSEKTYSFTYDQTQNEYVEFGNERDDWQINISKRDADTNLELGGALFGLYSANSEMLISNEVQNDIKAKYKLDNLITTITVDGVTYYLCDTAETDAEWGEASWQNLTEDVYAVKELVAPSGYICEDTQTVVVYGTDTISAKDETTGETVVKKDLSFTNIRAVDLPQTGGSGGKLPQLVGSALAAAAAMLILLKLRKSLAEI